MRTLLTAFFTQHKQELRGAVLDVRVYVRHQAHQLVPQGVADLRPGHHISQWGENLRTTASTLTTGQDTPTHPLTKTVDLSGT